MCLVVYISMGAVRGSSRSRDLKSLVLIPPNEGSLASTDDSAQGMSRPGNALAESMGSIII
jgi:hypothetical protein